MDYFVDCRHTLDINEIDNKSDKMIKNYKNERNKIINKMRTLKKENIFDVLIEPIKKSKWLKNKHMPFQ